MYVLDMKPSRSMSPITQFRINNLSDVSSRTDTFLLELVVSLESILKTHCITTSLVFLQIDYISWLVHPEISRASRVSSQMFSESTCNIVRHAGVVGSILCFNNVYEIHEVNPLFAHAPHDKALCSAFEIGERLTRGHTHDLDTHDRNCGCHWCCGLHRKSSC